MRNLTRAGLLVLALAAVFSLLRPGRSTGVPLYAARQGLMCQSCHFDPNGGGPRNDFGFMFARNRHSLEPDTSSAWKDLNLTNRVSDAMPVYFGVNQRFMLLSNANMSQNEAERAAFFSMENALYVTFQPHSRLTLVYSRDAFDGQVIAQDAFGMISGLPLDGYVKAGRFRTPFGLRMDDHTVATRAGYLNLAGGPPQSFLPYDPRFPDMGVEFGGNRGPFFGRASYTNGNSNVFGAQPFAQTVAAKLGYNRNGYQGGFSFHDDYEKTGLFPFRRATRWGYYGLFHWQQLQAIGEIGAGTNQNTSLGPGEHTNVLAGFGELDWTASRSVNLRARYDLLQLDRDGTLQTRPDNSTISTSDLNTWSRYAIEAEYLPVPFAELRATFRLIVPKADRDIAGDDTRTERQGYLQFHFSY